MGILVWIVEKTKVGKFVKATQDWLDGKKQYIAGASMAFPALVTIVQHFQTGGVQYILGATHSPEYLAFTAGLAIIANAAKGEKIRAENAQIIAKQETPPPPAATSSAS